MMELNTESVVVRQNNDLMQGELADELIMLDINKGNYVSLNKVGINIWELIEIPITIKKIITILLSNYNVSQETCKTETMNFLKQLETNGFLLIDPQQQ